MRRDYVRQVAHSEHEQRYTRLTVLISESSRPVLSFLFHALSAAIHDHVSYNFRRSGDAALVSYCNAQPATEEKRVSPTTAVACPQLVALRFFTPHNVTVCRGVLVIAACATPLGIPWIMPLPCGLLMGSRLHEVAEMASPS
jgi:hypothetical protein